MPRVCPHLLHDTEAQRGGALCIWRGALCAGVLLPVAVGWLWLWGGCGYGSLQPF